MARSLRLMASYTYLDAEVTESLSGGVLAPAFNPAFPGIPIGQFSPLVGARPFRRPAALGLVHGRLFARAGRRGRVGVLLGQARRQHVPERRVLRLLDAAAEPGPRGRVPEGGSQRRLPRAPRLARVRQHREPVRQGLPGVVRVPGAAAHRARRRHGHRSAATDFWIRHRPPQAGAVTSNAASQGAGTRNCEASAGSAGKSLAPG